MLDIKVIQGKEKESRIIQDPMFIYIMKELGEEKIPDGQEARIFKQIVKNIHATMRSPYGKLESMRKNSLKNEIQGILYAVKDLETIPRLLSEEEYFRQTCFMDNEFMKIWNIARQETHNFLNKIKKFGPGKRKTSITISMVDRYVKEHGLEDLQTQLTNCVGGLFRSWQTVWYNYQEILIFANNLGNNYNKIKTGLN
jgi:hypothetical protein